MRLIKVATCVAAAFIVVAGSASAQTYQLSFPSGSDGVLGNTCTDGSCSNSEVIRANYGSVAGVVNSIHGSFATTPSMSGGAANASWWSVCCGGLTGAAWEYSGAASWSFFEFDAVPAGGSITLNSFQLGYFNAATRRVSYQIWDETGVRASGSSDIAGGAGGSPVTFSPNISSTGANGILRLFWSGFDQTLGGNSTGDWLIDNINFTVNSGAGTPSDVVPEPASMTLLATGLVAMGTAARRRRRRAS